MSLFCIRLRLFSPFSTVFFRYSPIHDILCSLLTFPKISNKIMIHSFIVICPQCRKRLDETPDVKDSPKTLAAVSVPQPEAAAACLSELDKVRPSLQDLRTVAAHSRFVICTNMSISGRVNRYKSIRRNRRNNDCA